MPVIETSVDADALGAKAASLSSNIGAWAVVFYHSREGKELVAELTCLVC